MKKKDFNNLLTGVRQAREIMAGRMKPARVARVEVVDIKALRKRLGKSQSELAAMLDISVDTLQNWEQGRARPVGPAQALLRVAARYPKQVETALTQ